ncbi:hypothetical protein AD939_00430 [Gluconobacter oxydans]|nr:hypothetical protein AD939_00430 [Gluconobacter oxydans]
MEVLGIKKFGQVFQILLLMLQPQRPVALSRISFKMEIPFSTLVLKMHKSSFLVDHSMLTLEPIAGALRKEM